MAGRGKLSTSDPQLLLLVNDCLMNLAVVLVVIYGDGWQRDRFDVVVVVSRFDLPATKRHHMGARAFDRTNC